MWKVFSDKANLEISHKCVITYSLTHLDCHCSAADILPGLRTPLISINKIAKEGYTTVFHPGEKGVTIHKPGTISITTTEPLILQGGKLKEQNYGNTKRE